MKALRAGHLLQRPDDFCLGSGSETGNGEGNCFLHAFKPGCHSFGNNDFRRDFTVKDAGTKDGLEWIDAVPKLHDTSFTDIRIGFRDGLPAAMTLKDSFGQTITLHMSDMKRILQSAAQRLNSVLRKGRKFSVSKSAVFHENPRNILIIKES